MSFFRKSRLHKILRNAFFLLCMNLGNLFALFVFSVLLTTTMGKETLGLYTLFTATLMPFAYFVDFGQSTSLIQEIGSAPQSTSKLLKNTLVIKVLLTLGATLVLIAVSWILFDQAPERRLFWLFGLILLPRAFYSSFEATLRAHQKMSKLLYANLPTSLLLIGGSWLLLRQGFGLLAILVFLITLEVLKAIVVWLIADRTLGLTFRGAAPKLEIAYCRRLLRRSLPFFSIGIVGILHYRLDIVLLAHLRDHSEVGIFAGASNFVNVLRFAPSVIVAAFFPAISGLGRNSQEVQVLSKRTLGVQLCSAVVLSSAVFALAPVLISHTYRIPESVAVIRLLVWAMLPMSIYSTLIYFFYQTDRASWSLKILSIAVVLNVGLNAMLIPKLGAMALAISTLASETLAFVLCFALYLSLLRGRKAEFEEERAGIQETALLDYRGSA